MSSRRILTRNLEKFKKDINQKLKENKELLHSISTRMGDAEQHIGEMGTWNSAVKEILEQSLKNQHALHAKVTELDGFSHRHTISLYNVVEGAEKNLMSKFVEGLFKDILEDDTDLGIERAHRALAPKPPSGAPPRSIVVRFLKFSVKEKVLHAT